MTLRIFVEAHSDGGVVALHGWLRAAEVEEVERVIAELRGPSRVDLAQLAGVDEEGLRALRRLEEQGTSLIGARPYIALLLGWTVAEGPGAPGK